MSHLFSSAIRGILFALLAAIPVMTAAIPADAQPNATSAKAAIVLDLSTGAILLEKNADVPLPPASMSKLMTLYMIFEALESDRIGLDDKFRTSRRASQMGGSKMFIREGEVVSIRDLLRGVIIQSGNDAAVALAEALSGTEEAFAELMTRRAREIGLRNSEFANATGWPDPRQRMSVRDLATLAERLIEEFPKEYELFSETEFTWDDITQQNRNPLLGLGIGVDGLKTGHTVEAGYGLVASAKRGGRRVIVVISGMPSSAERRREGERLINWAFRAFEARTLFRRGESIAEADVWIGASDRVGLTPTEDVIVSVPYGRAAETEVFLTFRSPIEAPIPAGEIIGKMEIRVPDLPPRILPLVAAEEVGKGGFLKRIQAAGSLLLSLAFGALGG